MEVVNIVNIVVTITCILALMLYFNFREKKLRKMAEDKILNLKGVYINETLKIKEKEEKEIEKIKSIVDKLEHKHKSIEEEHKKTVEEKANYHKEAQEIIHQAEERAKKIEAEIKNNAEKFMEEQKQEVQTKMVDLVIGVTEKVLAKSLDYDQHKQLVREALAEMEGDLQHE